LTMALAYHKIVHVPETDEVPAHPGRGRDAAEAERQARHDTREAMSTRPGLAPVETESVRPELAHVGPWRVVVLNDPVNSMSYVVLVFRKVFGFDEALARHHMLEVHEQGRSVVWAGLRERAEAYAFALQQWHLTVVLENE
jgi:ATP-dependent Clp protease adaptor protein ClpS